jgi:heme exporter protein D
MQEEGELTVFLSEGCVWALVWIAAAIAVAAVVITVVTVRRKH